MTTIVNSWDEYENLPYEIQLKLQQMAIVSIVAGGLGDEITAQSEEDKSFSAAVDKFFASYLESETKNFKIGPALYEPLMTHTAIQLLKQNHI
jgi:hypothetical protein